MSKLFTEYSEYLSRLFPGLKVQKISVNAGATCPNRDGTLSTGGCIYCNNSSFTPGYCAPGLPVAEQIAAGKRFFARKYPSMKYLAYFQSFTNTYGEFQAAWREALAQEDVVGLVIGTRPDALSADVVEELAALRRDVPVIVEIGAETSHDATLERINRHHTFRQTEEAVLRCNDAGLEVGLHLIMGLPGEDEEMMLRTVERVCALPVGTLKFHQLQVIRGTRLHEMWQADPDSVPLFTPEEYLRLCRKIAAMVPRRIAIERFVAQAPDSLLVAPRWGLKNYQFLNLLAKEPF